MYSCRQKNVVLCIEVLNSRRKRSSEFSENNHEDYANQFMIESSYQKYLEDVID